MRRDLRTVGVTALAGALCLAIVGTPVANATRSRNPAPAAGLYIVQASSAGNAAAAVQSAGGSVVVSLPVVAGVDAHLSAASLTTLEARPSIHVTHDVTIQAAGNDFAGSAQAAQLAQMDLGAGWSTKAGGGVGVALIDTGVGNTPGVTSSNLVRSPDFSGEGTTIDGYGHGTFMAGLIAGNGMGGPTAVPGVAPGVTLVSVKVADAAGTTSLARMIEGIGWAVQNRDAYDIRVMSISFGADTGVAPSADPLDMAVEAAWASGIVVVAAAGNEGAGQVTSPGDDPWVITVGTETTTRPASSPSWSSFSSTKPDILAPGVSVTSLRDPGSIVDLANPSARVGGLYFVGSGTSMSTAMTAGAAALLIVDHPDATPDDVKGALLAGAGTAIVGTAGPIDVAAADSSTAQPAWWQSQPIALPGLGTTMPWATGQWTPATWTAMHWGAMSWSQVTWTAMHWGAETWDAMHWGAMHWGAESWGAQS